MGTRLAVVGQGYVGLPLALRACEMGLDVTGFDIDEELVALLNSGRSHVSDVSDESLLAALRAGYQCTSDPATIAGSDVVVVCVPTPLAAGGGPDLSAIEESARMIGRHVTSETLVILESTTYPGTTEEMFAPLVLGDRFSLDDIPIAFSPERIDPGNAQFGVQNTPKVVGGLTDRATREAVAFYELFIDSVVEAKGAKEAEMAKLLENTFRHVNIALVNEMLRFSNELDIDLWDAIDCAATKPFGYMAFRPGPGVGGHCIPVDPSYLSHRVKAQLGYAFRMVELAQEINLAAPVYVASRLTDVLNGARIAVNGAKVLLVGVTYKPDIADQRESPAIPLAQRLAAMGADLTYHDPHVLEWSPWTDPHRANVARADDVYEASGRADAVILLQPHQEYDLGLLGRSARRLLDTRGVVPRSEGVLWL